MFFITCYTYNCVLCTKIIAIIIGIQTDAVLTKDIAIQCSLLPTTSNSDPEPDTVTESDNEATEIDETDTDYMTETSDV